jgi:hypothetical protein
MITEKTQVIQWEAPITLDSSSVRSDVVCDRMCARYSLRRRNCVVLEDRVELHSVSSAPSGSFRR